MSYAPKKKRVKERRSFTVRLDDTLRRDLEKLAEADGRPFSSYAFRVLQQHVAACKSAA